MRVLMFGWEFPPHIAGGLGTATYGLTRGLAKHGVEVKMVVPKAYGDEDQRFVRVVNASDVVTRFGDVRHKEIWDKMTFIEIDSNIIPYATPEEYFAKREEWARTGKTSETTDIWQGRFSFSGRYGENLMEEVARYAMVAAEVAKQMEGEFDVIHAHDWLTYYAGIAAKAVSGKPLVVHMLTIKPKPQEEPAMFMERYTHGRAHRRLMASAATMLPLQVYAPEVGRCPKPPILQICLQPSEKMLAARHRQLR